MSILQDKESKLFPLDLSLFFFLGVINLCMCEMRKSFGLKLSWVLQRMVMG